MLAAFKALVLTDVKITTNPMERDMRAACMATGTLRTENDDPAFVLSLSSLQTSTEFQAPWML